MRKLKIKLLLLGAMLGAYIVLTGCALTQAVSSNALAESSAVSVTTESSGTADTPTPTVAPSSTVVPTPIVQQGLTTDVIVQAYGAYTAFVDYWYRGGNANAMQTETTTYEGMTYCRYEADEVKTLVDLQSKALELMTQPLLDDLQANLLYVDIEGALYGPVNYGSGGEGSFAKDESESVQLSDTQYQLKVGHYYYAQGFIEDADADALMLRAETTATYSKTEAGWRFSSMEYVPTTIAG